MNMISINALVEIFTIALSVFFAELGDKTMLSTAFLALHTRRFLAIFIVSLSAFVAANILPIFLGCFIGGFVENYFTRIGAAIVFMFIGFWILFSKDKGFANISKGLASCFFAVFLSELGDKTQLTVASYAMIFRDPISTLLGGVIGYALANAIGVILAKLIGIKISYRGIRFVAGVAFIAIGLMLLLYIVLVNKP